MILFAFKRLSLKLYLFLLFGVCGGIFLLGLIFLRLKVPRGGIIVMWDKNIFNLVSSSQGEFSLTCFFQMVEGGFTWAFTGVYGPQARADK